jgi:hypothetical protein
LGDEVAAFGSDVDEVVGFGEDVGVVFDDDDGVPFVNEAVEDVDEAFHVGHVQADGGFFDELEVADAGFGEELPGAGDAGLGPLMRGGLKQTILGNWRSCNRLRSLRGRKIRDQYSGPFSI